MSDQDCHGVVTFDPFGELPPVVDSWIERIVRYNEQRLILVRKAFQDSIEPSYVLGREMSIPHFHDGPLVDADKPITPVLKNELVTSPEPGKLRAAGF